MGKMIKKIILHISILSMLVLTACSTNIVNNKEADYIPAITEETMSQAINMSVPFTWEYLSHDEENEYYMVTVPSDYVGNETDNYAVLYGNNYGQTGPMMTELVKLDDMKAGVEASIPLTVVQDLSEEHRILRVEDMTKPIKPIAVAEEELQRNASFAMDFIEAFKNGDYQFIDLRPRTLEWHSGIGAYPLFQYIHAYDSYCSALSNMGRFEVFCVNGKWLFGTCGETKTLSPSDIKDLNDKTFEKANEIVENLKAKRTSDLSEYEKAQEALTYINNLMKKASSSGSGYNGMNRMKGDIAYRALVQNLLGNGYYASFNILMQIQGIDSYGLMFTNRGRHASACLASLDGQLYICMPSENRMYKFNEIPSEWNLFSNYGNLDILSRIMNFDISKETLGVDPSSLGKKDAIEAGDGAIDILVDYISSDEKNNDIYHIYADTRSSANSTAKYQIYYGVGSKIQIGETVSYSELKSGVEVSVSIGERKRIDPEHEGNQFFVDVAY